MYMKVCTRDTYTYWYLFFFQETSEIDGCFFFHQSSINHIIIIIRVLYVHSAS